MSRYNMRQCTVDISNLWWYETVSPEDEAFIKWWLHCSFRLLSYYLWLLYTPKKYRHGSGYSRNTLLTQNKFVGWEVHHRLKAMLPFMYVYLVDRHHHLFKWWPTISMKTAKWIIDLRGHQHIQVRWPVYIKQAPPSDYNQIMTITTNENSTVDSWRWCVTVQYSKAEYFGWKHGKKLTGHRNANQYFPLIYCLHVQTLAKWSYWHAPTNWIGHTSFGITYLWVVWMAGFLFQRLRRYYVSLQHAWYLIRFTRV